MSPNPIFKGLATIGYSISPQHGPLDALANEASIQQRCPSCSLATRVDPALFRTKVLKSQTKYDLLWAYDLRSIFSERFTELLRAKSSTAFKTYSVAKAKYNFIMPEKTVTFDHIWGGGTNRVNLCMTCGQYKDLVGAHPVILKEKCINDSGLYATDTAFGSGHNKSPILIVGSTLKATIEGADFKGFYFEEAYSTAAET